MRDLATLQRTFMRAILSADGVEAVLWDAGERGRELELALAGDARLDGVGRLRIYADMVAARLREALAVTFPAVAKVAGETRFASLSAEYFEACPSRQPSLRDAGALFAAFLDYAGEPGCLADLARLEWARHDVFDELDEPLLDEPALRAVPPEAFGELPLALIAAHRLVELDHDVVALWKDAGPAPPRATTLLVWREDTSVYHRALDALEARCLRHLAAGPATFGELCARVVDEVGEDEAPARAFALLARWVQDGLLRGAE
jgi:hypothetical protein